MRYLRACLTGLLAGIVALGMLGIAITLFVFLPAYYEPFLGVRHGDYGLSFLISFLNGLFMIAFGAGFAFYLSETKQ